MATVLAASGARLAFHKIWRLSGKPTLKAIRPTSAWVLPVGVTYSAFQDQFVNGAGTAVAVDATNQPAVEMAFLPIQEQHVVRLSIPGVTTTDSHSVAVLWSETHEAAIRDAWGILIGTTVYRVKAWAAIPPGVDRPVQINIELGER